MLKFTLTSKGWEIAEKGQIIFSGIRTCEQALAIAKANSVILSEFYNQKLRAA